MAASDAVIETWLDDWQHCLELWLACGVSAPTTQARAALQQWLVGCETAGWHDAQALAERLLNNALPATQRASALLDLLVWQQSARRVYQARRLAELYSSE